MSSENPFDNMTVISTVTRQDLIDMGDMESLDMELNVKSFVPKIKHFDMEFHVKSVRKIT